jgi:hypothetical protein
MSEPVYVGMPDVNRIFTVGHWGEIRCGGPCKDDYARIQVDTRHAGGLVKLQKAALESFQNAEQELGYEIELTGSWRSCSTAHLLYARDSARYAPPDKGAHMRGLAIDVTTAYSVVKKKEILAALAKRHWHQARPTDEPWHHSFGIQV